MAQPSADASELGFVDPTSRLDARSRVRLEGNPSYIKEFLILVYVIVDSLDLDFLCYKYLFTQLILNQAG